MNYKDIVESILVNIGGVDNVSNVSHCLTRLRFVLKDKNMVNKEAVEEIAGVLGSTFGAGQYQIIMGEHLDKTYTELMNNYKFEKEDVSDMTNKKTKEPISIKSISKSIIDYMSGSVSPVITGLIRLLTIK